MSESQRVRASESQETRATSVEFNTHHDRHELRESVRALPIHLLIQLGTPPAHSIVCQRVRQRVIVYPPQKSGWFALSLRLDTYQPLPAELPLFAEPPRVASGTGRTVADPGSLLTNG